MTLSRIDPISAQNIYQEAKVLNEDRKYVESSKLIEPLLKSRILEEDKKFRGQLLALAGDNNFYIGNYEPALRQSLEAEKVFKELKLIHELSAVESNLGSVYSRMGLYVHSLFKNLEALTYSFQVNEEYTMTCSLMNAASSLFETGYSEKAFRALDTAMLVCDKKAGERKYEQIRLVIYNNKATFCAHLNRFDEMLELLEQAKVIAKKFGFKENFVLIDSNIAMCLVKLNRFEEGYRLLKSVLRRRKNSHDDHYVADLAKMGVIYKDYLHDNGRFLEYMKKALKLAEKNNLITRQITVYTALRDFYKAQKNLAQLHQVESRLKVLTDQDNLNRQTGGIENLYDTNLIAVENMLRDKDQNEEFLNRYDYMIGAYSYTQHGITLHVLLRDIAFCEIRGNYLHIHTFTRSTAGEMILEESHKVRSTMKDFISQITTSKSFFVRIHNSFIINLHWLTRDALKRGDSVVIGGKELKISNTYRNSFRKRLNLFLKEEAGIAGA